MGWTLRTRRRNWVTNLDYRIAGTGIMTGGRVCALFPLLDDIHIFHRGVRTISVAPLYDDTTVYACMTT